VPTTDFPIFFLVSDIIDRAVLVERGISTIDLADFIVCDEKKAVEVARSVAMMRVLNENIFGSELGDSIVGRSFRCETVKYRGYGLSVCNALNCTEL
jgi:hypothetical protein